MTYTMAAIATRMAEQSISLESIVQRRARGELESEQAPIILITHETTEQSIREALKGVREDGCLFGEPQMIRIESLG